MKEGDFNVNNSLDDSGGVAYLLYLNTSLQLVGSVDFKLLGLA